jgi:hypothetical protein
MTIFVDVGFKYPELESLVKELPGLHADKDTYFGLWDSIPMVCQPIRHEIVDSLDNVTRLNDK